MRRRLPKQPEASAKLASCRYVDDSGPGIRRVRSGKGFRYLSKSGATIHDRATLRRIKSLVIPPAWTDVWICPDPDGHIQATGRDARRRKQYRYHPRFREIREETKYEHVIAFAEVLPKIRARVDEDMSRPGLGRDKVLATIVRLLEITLIRVGNEEYARENGTFGLTTLRTRHVDIDGSTIRIQFKGKSGKKHALEVNDRRLAKLVARFHDLPGQELFQYEDEDGELRSVEAADVNEYLRRISEKDVTAKDFRTWAGTVLAALALREMPEEVATKKSIVQAVKNVSERLGNTPAVCRRCYVHPEIWSAYMDGQLTSTLKARADAELRENGSELSSAEATVLRLLRDRLAPRVARAA